LTVLRWVTLTKTVLGDRLSFLATREVSELRRLESQALQFGMPVSRDVYRDTPPWIDWHGCCPNGNNWTCAVCTHMW
jgi:hypothetical protein